MPRIIGVNMEVIDNKKALDITIDAVLICTSMGSKVGDTFVYRDPDSGFVITKTDKFVQVSAYISGHEEAGEAMLLVDLRNKQPVPKIFKAGPWIERVQEIYELFMAKRSLQQDN